MKICCCDKCAALIRASFVLTPTGREPFMGWCECVLPRHRALLTEYERMTVREARRREREERRETAPRLPYKPKDTRAKAREPFRDW